MLGLPVVPAWAMAAGLTGQTRAPGRDRLRGGGLPPGAPSVNGTGATEAQETAPARECGPP